MKLPASHANSIGPRPFDRAFVQTFICNSLGLVLATVTGILAARTLGPLGRGELATILYYPAILAHFGRLGIHEATAFEMSRRPQDEAKLLRAGFWLAVLLGVPQVVLGAMLAPLLLPAAKGHLIGTLQWAMIFPLLFYCNWVLLAVDQGSFRFARFNVLQLVPGITYAVGMTAFWLMGMADVVTFTVAYLSAYIVVVLIRMSFSYRDLITGLPLWADIKCLLRRGWQLHLAHLGLIGMNGTDVLVLVSLLPSDQVGLYAAALALAGIQSALSSALSQVGFVKVAGEANKTVAMTNLIKQFRVAQLVTLVLMGTCLALAPYLMLYAFGSAFMPAVPTAYWLIGAFGISALTSLLDSGFRALGRSWVAGIGYGLGVTIMVVGGLWLVPTGGMLAMAKVRFVACGGVLLIYCASLLALEAIPIQRLWGLRPDAVQILWSRIRVFVRS